MDKLYSAIFGVFMSSSDDDFNNFINVVKSVLNNENYNKKTKKSFLRNYLIIGLVTIVFVIIFVIFYLKVIK
ncbi:viral morphogenesis protein [Sheeppox virus]|uniref:Viral morphogenesis protein n=1 Tax=Sheeppox virus TaxID=10266 RepID=A0A5C0PUY6_SHEV|nr:viral morphogenesis protein [Sheeppox virus]QEJ80383.1 viral morphogenesis protein [Sheeppox virus]